MESSNFQEEIMDTLYVKEKGCISRWASFENPLGEKGKAGQANGGAKGMPCRPVPAGASVVLMDVTGSGMINRMWMTHTSISSNVMMRSLRIDMYWDGEAKPAVSAPLGDFFGAPLGRAIKFESALLSNPEGRSLVSYFRMPFLKGAKVVLTNESDKNLDLLFYDISYTLRPLDPEKILYFHAYWNRENPTKLCQNYTILPKLPGEGKFIGTNVGVQTDPGYGETWFGEGEFKVYLDGDEKYPTLCGTGTEDYIGSGWGMREFCSRTQGCFLFKQKEGLFSFYRFHLEDSISFYQDIKVQIQVMGGAMRDDLLKVIEKGIPVKICGCGGEFLFEKNFVLDKSSPEGGYNFYREDDYSSTAYFYYDKPSSGLPVLPSCGERIKDLRDLKA
jgi:hypothetical protein